MKLETDKPFWLSRNNLINLFSVDEFKEKVIKINVSNSKEFKDFGALNSLISHNKNLIILETEDYNIYLSLPFNFKSNFNSLDEIINFIQNDKEIFIFFIELGSWIIGKIKFKEILASKRGARYVKGRHKAGGQSQRRFERNREKWIEELYKKFVLDINDFFKKNLEESDYYLAFGEEKVINDLFNYEFKNKNKFIKRKSSLKNYNSKTLVSASTNIWSSRVYIDKKNAIVKNYE
jgi:hypothetical protein